MSDVESRLTKLESDFVSMNNTVNPPPLIHAWTDVSATWSGASALGKTWFPDDTAYSGHRSMRID